MTRDGATVARTRSVGRTLLQILVFGILLPAALIWGLGHFTSREAVRLMWQGLSKEIAGHSVESTLRYLETGETALALNSSMVDLGLTDPANRKSMLEYLLAGLKANPNVTWYSFGGADGVYLSAYRPPTSEGGYRVTWREQVEGGALYRDFRVEDDGTWTPLPEKTQPYDCRTRVWYKAALEREGPVWSKPFLFASGPPGFILSSKVQRADGTFLGVWGIEYEMSYVSDFLSRLEIGTDNKGRAYLVTAAGEVIGHPEVGEKIGEADGFIVTEQDGKKVIATAANHRDERLRQAFLRSQTMSDEEMNRRFEIDGEPYFAAVQRFPETSRLDWTILIVVPQDDILGDIPRNEIYAAIAAIVIAVMFLLFAQRYASRRITQPLKSIAREFEEMSSLSTEQTPSADDSPVTEVAGMMRAREVMRTGLRSFKKYVPLDLVRQLMESGRAPELGGERRSMTVMFSDVVDFTRISEELGEPEELVSALAEYLDVMSAMIAKQNGTVDKYIGDAIMAFWGAPQENPEHALSACHAAWASQQALSALRMRWGAEGHPLFRAKIGINTGEMLVGNIGSERRMDYTVMGDAVNLASRIEGLCAIYGLEIAVGENTWDAVKGEFEGRPVDCVEVKGKSKSVVFYELLGPKGTVSAQVLAFGAAYTEAFERYRARGFDAACAAFRTAHEMRPEDVAAREMVSRCEAYQREPPPDDWTGAVRLTRKS